MSLFGTSSRSMGKRLKEGRYQQADLVGDGAVGGSMAQRYRNKTALRKTASVSSDEPAGPQSPAIISTRDWLAQHQQQRSNKTSRASVASIPWSSGTPAPIANGGGGDGVASMSSAGFTGPATESRLVRSGSDPELVDVGKVGTSERETRRDGRSSKNDDGNTSAQHADQIHRDSSTVNSRFSLAQSKQRFRSENDLLSAMQQQPLQLVAIDDVTATDSDGLLQSDQNFSERLQIAIKQCPRIVAMPRGKEGCGFSIDVFECESIRIPRIVRVLTNSFAHIAGIQVGDFIVEVNGDRVIGDIADDCDSMLEQCGDVLKMVIVTVNVDTADKTYSSVQKGARSHPSVAVSNHLASISSRSDVAASVGEELKLELRRHLRQPSIDVPGMACDDHSASSLEDTGSALLDTPTSGYGSALEVGSDDSHGVVLDPIGASTDSQGIKKSSGIKALQSTLNLNFGSVGDSRSQRSDGNGGGSRSTGEAASDGRGGSVSSADVPIVDNYERLPFQQSTRAANPPPQPPPPPPLRRSTLSTADDRTSNTPDVGTRSSTDPAAEEDSVNILRSKSTPGDESVEDFLRRAELLRRNYVRKSQMMSEQADVLMPPNVDPANAKDNTAKAAATIGNEARANGGHSTRKIELYASNGSGSVRGEDFHQTISQPMAGHTDNGSSSVTRDAKAVGVNIAKDMKLKPAAPLKPVLSRRPSENEVVEPRMESDQFAPTATGDAFRVPLLPRAKVSERPPPPKRTISSQSVYANLPDPMPTTDDKVDDDPYLLPPPPSEFFAESMTTVAADDITSVAAAAAVAAMATVVKPTTRPKVAPKVGVRRASAVDVDNNYSVFPSTPNLSLKTIASEPLITGRAASRPSNTGKQHSTDMCSPTSSTPSSPANDDAKIYLASGRSSLPSAAATDQLVHLPPPQVFDDVTPTSRDVLPAVTSENRRPPPTAAKPKIIQPHTSTSSLESPTSAAVFSDAAVDRFTTPTHDGNSDDVSDDLLFVPLPPPVAYDDDVRRHNDVSADRDRHHEPSTLPKHNISAVPKGAGLLGAKSVRNWSVEDVGRWLDQTLLGQHRERFRVGGIDGRQLASLDRSRLIELGVVEVGDRMAIERQLRKILPSV